MRRAFRAAPHPSCSPPMSSARRRSCASARGAWGYVLQGRGRAARSGDIERPSAALQCAWDGECGYFSYVLHDDAGRPQGFLRTDAGENADKGLDGVYPLVAGACTARQQSTALAHLKSTKELFSPVGLTAVDMSARLLPG